MSSLEMVRNEIARTCILSGRSPDSVRVLVDARRREVDELSRLRGLEDVVVGTVDGARLLARKLPGMRWHMVKNLHANKAFLAVSMLDHVHGVSKTCTLVRLEEHCAKKGEAIAVSLKIAMTGKAKGLAPEQLGEFLDQAARLGLKHVTVAGLSTRLDESLTPSERRQAYARMRELLEQARRSHPQLVVGKELTMGDDRDYALAVAEGATRVVVEDVFEPMAIAC